MLAEGLRNGVEVGGADLDDGAEFFIEEGAVDVVARENFEIDAGMTCKGHLGDGGEEAAVGTVVVGEEFAVAAELLDDGPKLLEVVGAVDVGRGFTHLRNDLSEDGTAEAVFAAAEIDQEQDGVADEFGGLRVER